MDEKERLRLKKLYEEEMVDDELIDMAQYDAQEYEEGVYSLLMDAIRKRGLEEKLSNFRIIQDDKIDGLNWVSLCRFYEPMEGEFIEALLKEKEIPVQIISHECSAYDGAFKSASGAGDIIVREDFLNQAKEILMEFQKQTQDDEESTLDQDLFLQAVTTILEKHNINNIESIKDEILNEFNRIKE